MRVIGHGHAVRLAVSWLTMFLVGTELFVVSPLLPLISADFQSSPRLAGLTVAIFALTYMISAPLFGQLADRIGRRRVLIYCLCAFAAANLLTAAAANLTCLLAARLLAGAVAAGVSPSVYALVAGIAPLDPTRHVAGSGRLRAIGIALNRRTDRRCGGCSCRLAQRLLGSCCRQPGAGLAQRANLAAGQPRCAG
jgi:predicted MFS family arabinose efflux permease